MVALAIVGFLTGFLFSVPVAGPISVYLTSHGLRGNLRHGVFVAVGAAIVDYLYCMLAVLGFSFLLKINRNLIPALLAVGTIFIFVIGIRIIQAHRKGSGLQEVQAVKERKGHHSFFTGFLINFLNPTLFFGWFSSTIMIFSMISALGVIDKDVLPILNNSAAQGDLSTVLNPQLLLRANVYALSLAIGTIVWFYIYLRILVAHRGKFEVETINKVIRVLGYVLCGFGLYLGWQSYQYFVK